MAATANTTAGLFVTPESITAAKHASQLAGVVEGQELARMFAWMRPNDLIWNYWVNNYLLGNAPPARMCENLHDSRPIARLRWGLCLIRVVFNDPLSALTRKPVPCLGHVVQLLF
jgi:poly(3-hydroxyalkanoate) synthetase